MKSLALAAIASALLALPGHHAVAAKSNSRVAYIPISGGNVVCILDLDTLANSCSLKTEEGIHDWVPTWSPDGTMIAISQTTHGHGRIEVLSANGGNHLSNGRPSPSLITGVGTVPGGRPMWSSDSRRVAGINDNGIAIATLGGGEPDVIELGQRRVSDAAWSPDSANFAVGYIDGDERGIALVLVDAKTGAQKVLRHFAGSSSASSIVYDISWSPNGQQVLFTYSPSVPQLLNSSQHWLISADGSNEKMLYQGPVEGGEFLEARFTADGQWIMFEGYGDKSTDIFVIRPDGSDVHELTNSVTGADWPRPAGDGRILYRERSPYPSRMNMVIFNTDDPERRTVKPLVVADVFAWSPVPGRLPPDAVTLTPLPTATTTATPRPTSTPFRQPSPTPIALQGPNVGDGASGNGPKQAYAVLGMLGTGALLGGLAFRRIVLRRR